MSPINRRVFLTCAGIAPFGAGTSMASSRGDVIDHTLRSGVVRSKIPAVVAMVASERKTLYSGAFGVRDSSGVPIHVDSIFRIASMTKAITTVATLQLVERGKVGLDEPVARYLPQFEKIQVLRGFSAKGEPSLRAAVTQPTLRHLLTHTSGFCYDIWDGDMFRYAAKRRESATGPGPLMFEPGTRWSYGTGLDWAGHLVEVISGMTLEEYFQQEILRPLGMEDTTYVLPAAKFERLASSYQRSKDGTLQQNERKLPNPPQTYDGGGGLFSTAADYVLFMQMILNRGMGLNKVRILQGKTIASMELNQIGSLTAGKMKSFQPELSSDVDIQPGHTEKWGLGFLINTTAYPGGRSAGSLAWAGFYNTFYWIDPERSLCAVILMQFLPFVDKEAVRMLNEFEQAVYGVGLV